MTAVTASFGASDATYQAYHPWKRALRPGTQFRAHGHKQAWIPTLQSKLAQKLIYYVVMRHLVMSWGLKSSYTAVLDRTCTASPATGAKHGSSAPTPDKRLHTDKKRTVEHARSVIAPWYQRCGRLLDRMHVLYAAGRTPNAGYGSHVRGEENMSFRQVQCLDMSLRAHGVFVFLIFTAAKASLRNSSTESTWCSTKMLAALT